MGYFNSSHLPDPTAWEAEQNIAREENELRRSENKRKLQTAYAAHVELKGIERELKELESSLDGLRAVDPSRAPGAGHDTEAAFEKLVDKYCDRISALINKKSELISRIEEISSEIDRMTNVNERQVLRYRHVCFCSWDEIAEQMCYEQRQIFRIYRSALLHFGE